MSSMGERIKESREKKGILQSELAKMIGVKSSGVISNWEKDINKPDANRIVQLCQALDISASYLLDYYGELVEDTFSDEAKQIALNYDKLDNYGKESTKMHIKAELYRTIQQTKEKMMAEAAEEHTAAFIRLHRSVQPASAGTGMFLGPDDFETIYVRDNPLIRRASFGVPVSGDSMEPDYHDGDTLLVEATDSIHVGEVGVFTLNGQGYVKKRGVQELISLNPEYDPIPMNESIRCNGRVIGILDPKWIVKQ